jgi:hypothetical protein
VKIITDTRHSGDAPARAQEDVILASSLLRMFLGDYEGGAPGKAHHHQRALLGQASLSNGVTAD